MDMEKLKPIVGMSQWHLFEDYLEERKQDYIARLVNEEHDKNAAVLRGRLKELDTLLSLASRIFPDRKIKH
jgi:hypothetical protein